MSEGVDDRELRRFQRALADYTCWNQRELGSLLESRARRLRFSLFRRFREIAPTPERIEAEARARDYAIRRGFTGSGKRRTLKQELAARKRSRGYLAASFIFRQWRGKPGQQGLFPARSRRGYAIGESLVRAAKGIKRPSIRLTSFLEGAVEQNRQRGIVNAALRDEVADMRSYLRRKQRDQFMRTVREALAR